MPLPLSAAAGQSPVPVPSFGRENILATRQSWFEAARSGNDRELWGRELALEGATQHACQPPPEWAVRLSVVRGFARVHLVPVCGFWTCPAPCPHHRPSLCQHDARGARFGFAAPFETDAADNGEGGHV